MALYPTSQLINEDAIIESSLLNHSHGTIFLIHGSAPFNADGLIPGISSHSPYTKQPFFKDLALQLRAAGWNVARYSKFGVTSTGIDFDLYQRTDYNCLAQQLKQIWQALPADKPRIAFAWSEGSLHVRALPLNEVAGVIFLGGIATHIGEVIITQGGPPVSQMRQMLADKEPTEMLGLDRPVSRLLDELNFEDNWKVFLPYPQLPILVLHGERDEEVSVQQAKLWRKYLPKHKLTVKIGAELDHRYMPDEQYNLDLLGLEVITWLKQTLAESKA